MHLLSTSRLVATPSQLPDADARSHETDQQQERRTARHMLQQSDRRSSGSSTCFVPYANPPDDEIVRADHLAGGSSSICSQCVCRRTEACPVLSPLHPVQHRLYCKSNNTAERASLPANLELSRLEAITPRRSNLPQLFNKDRPGTASPRGRD
jgi:hypothetical protein